MKVLCLWSTLSEIFVHKSLQKGFQSMLVLKEVFLSIKDFEGRLCVHRRLFEGPVSLKDP